MKYIVRYSYIPFNARTQLLIPTLNFEEARIHKYTIIDAFDMMSLLSKFYQDVTDFRQGTNLRLNIDIVP